MFSLISKVPVCFSGSRECAYSNSHTVNSEKGIVTWILGFIFTNKKNFTDYRVTQQETTFTRTISRNLRLQTKTPEK